MNKNNHKSVKKQQHYDSINSPSWRNNYKFSISKPSTLLWLTICYMIVVFFVIIGVPWKRSSNPIDVEYLPIAISFFAVVYIFVIGFLLLWDKIKKK